MATLKGHQRACNNYINHSLSVINRIPTTHTPLLNRVACLSVREVKRGWAHLYFLTDVLENRR